MPLFFADKVLTIKLTGAPVGFDLSNDGSLLAISIDAASGKPSVQIYRTADGGLVAEFGTNTGPGYGVVFAEKASQVFYLAEDDSGNKHLYRAALDQDTAVHVAEYGIGEICHALIRDLEGQIIGVLGNFIDIWTVKTGEVGYHIEGADPNQRIYASLSASDPYLFAYGTVESNIVCYDISRDQEVARWPAPRPFGQQLDVSPSGRLFVAVGEGVEGIFVYDTDTGDRIQTARYHRTSLIPGLYTFSHDDSLLIYGTTGVRGIRLEKGEWVKGPRLVPDIRQTAIASAQQAPVVVFGFADGSVQWLQLVERPEGPE